jgi:hypothetical protein
LLLASDQAADMLAAEVTVAVRPSLGDRVATTDAVNMLRRYFLVMPAGVVWF